MANEPFMDRWTLNGTEVLLQDHGRDQANGVPVLDNEAKLPLSYLPQDYASNLKVDPRDPNDTLFTDWLLALREDDFITSGTLWHRATLEGVTTGNYSIDVVLMYKNLYVATMYSSAISPATFWSEDGKTFNRSSGIPTTNQGEGISGAIFNNKLYIGTASAGLYVSEDGKTYTNVNGAPTNRILYILSTSSLLLLATTNGVYWSEDGITFTQGTVTNGINVRYISYANGLYVAGTASGVYWSENGKDWHNTSVTTDTSYLCYSSDLQLWVSGSGNQSASGNVFHWSSDGKTWNNASTSVTQLRVDGISYVNNLFIAITSARLYWSSDGKTWHQCTGETVVGSSMHSEVLCARGLFVLGHFYSYDGKAWLKGQIASGASPNSYGGRLGVYSDKFYVYGTNTGLLWSGVKIWLPPEE